MASQPSEALRPSCSGVPLRDVIRTRVKREHLRIHWLALGAAGMRPGDKVHVPMGYEFISEVANAMGCLRVDNPNHAHIVILSKPRENELLSQISRIARGNRIVVYNDENDIDEMTPRCFDLATACVFDRESGKVVRLFDHIEDGRRTTVSSYINVELTDINDSSLSIHASRIAALRRS